MSNSPLPLIMLKGGDNGHTKFMLKEGDIGHTKFVNIFKINVNILSI